MMDFERAHSPVESTFDTDRAALVAHPNSSRYSGSLCTKDPKISSREEPSALHARCESQRYPISGGPTGGSVAFAMRRQEPQSGRTEIHPRLIGCTRMLQRSSKADQTELNPIPASDFDQEEEDQMTATRDRISALVEGKGEERYAAFGLGSGSHWSS